MYTPKVKAVQTIQFECPRCHWTWVPMIEHPRCCPRCKRGFDWPIGKNSRERQDDRTAMMEAQPP
jgi:hypothetical protein